MARLQSSSSFSNWLQKGLDICNQLKARYNKIRKKTPGETGGEGIPKPSGESKRAYRLKRIGEGWIEPRIATKAAVLPLTRSKKMETLQNLLTLAIEFVVIAGFGGIAFPVPTRMSREMW